MMKKSKIREIARLSARFWADVSYLGDKTRFEHYIEDIIMREWKKREKDEKRLCIQTDYDPDEILSEALEKYDQDIKPVQGWQLFSCNGILPRKTTMLIYLHTGEVVVKEGYRAEWKTLNEKGE